MHHGNARKLCVTIAKRTFQTLKACFTSHSACCALRNSAPSFLRHGLKVLPAMLSCEFQLLQSLPYFSALWFG
eukprot:3500949-Amphidinium_carterae.1